MAHGLARFLLLIIILCALAVGLSGPGYRLGCFTDRLVASLRHRAPISTSPSFYMGQIGRTSIAP